MGSPDSQELSSIANHLERSALTKKQLQTQSAKILLIAEALLASVKKDGTLYSCGNGGSACDAMHFAEELVARYLRERPGIKAQHFCDGGTLTCWANDYDYESVFERQVNTFLSANDALLVFSTSGNSPNILRAVTAARKKGALTVALTGKTGGKLKDLAEHVIVVPSDETCHIQEAHIALVHIFCDYLERRVFA